MCAGVNDDNWGLLPFSLVTWKKTTERWQAVAAPGVRLEYEGRRPRQRPGGDGRVVPTTPERAIT